MVKAMMIRQTGGPEVMLLEDIPLPPPAPGEARIAHTAIGVNFIDTYYRKGLYRPAGGLPFVTGAEAAGVVEAVGEGVSDVAVGDRVAYAGDVGAYAEARNVAVRNLVRLPDDIDDRTAAAALLKGMTVRYLLMETYPVKASDTVLFHAGAGGVGQIAGQWLREIGATTIATVGSDEKAEIARAVGYSHVINYVREDFVARVKDITGGRKCDVVYDSVGRDTFLGSLDCLRPRGLLVSFGNSSGPVEGVNLGILSQKGSLYVTRPTLGTYTSTRAALEANAADLFDHIRRGIVKIDIGQSFPLDRAVDCHRALESRGTRGSTILTVG